MAPPAALSSEDKSKVKKAIPTSSSTNKIITAAVARVYQAREGSFTWEYTGVEGALVFVADKARGGLCFRVVDLAMGGGVIWDHELPKELEYNQDKPFFHTWQADNSSIAFVFAAESEASAFYKKVAHRSRYAIKSKEEKKEKESKGTPTKKKKGGFLKSLISGPSAGSFQHVAHMGYDSEKGFTSVGVDPSWQKLLEQLSAKGFSKQELDQNEDFIKDYVQQAGGIENAIAQGEREAQTKRAPPPPAPTSRRKPAPAPPAAAKSRPTSMVPPPPPPPPPGRSAPSAPSAPPPPPPPPPSGRGGAAPPPPPPPPPGPPGRSSAAPPAPPPPPPGRGAPPPPPPPPGRGGAGAGAGAPPPPPPPPAAGGGGGGGGRGALLASIQGQGVHKLKKVDPNQQRVSPLAGGGAAAAAAGGAAVGMGAGAAAAAAAASPSGGSDDPPDLASSLAAALNKRNQDMGSDEEDSEDSDWD